MVECDVEIWGLGVAHRRPLGPILIKENLRAFVSSSGFPGFRSWWTFASSFPSGKQGLYLYEITFDSKKAK
jgi:hypothetical protein